MYDFFDRASRPRPSTRTSKASTPRTAAERAVASIASQGRGVADGAGAADGPAGPRGRGYYSYDIGAWHLVALNSNCTRVSCGAG